jgi:uncharacterized protein YndB with AHSA1/START domain
VTAPAPLADLELEFHTQLAAPPDRVFAALTRAEHLARWFCDAAESDPREGGTLVCKWNRPGSSAEPYRGTWTTFDAPRTCAFAGGQPGHPDGYAGSCTWTLVPDTHGTRLVTVHRIPSKIEYAELAKTYTWAWPRSLDRLVAYLTPEK